MKIANRIRLKGWLILLGASALAFPARAEVTLPPLFSDHMVLQRDAKVPVWGLAAPGEEVVVEFAGRKLNTRADPAGHWRVTLDPLPASSEPKPLAVSGSLSPGKTVVHDVLVGEVWLCSGQSNMDMRVARGDRYWCGVTNEAAEIAAARYPSIRSFYVALKMSDDPQSEARGEWAVCSPETVGDFSATAYFFARELHGKLRVPVGLVVAAYGASTAQAWISRSALSANPALAGMLDDYARLAGTFTTNHAARTRYEQALAQWQTAAARARAEGKDRPREPRNPDPGQDQHNPCVLFNGMIAPLAPYAIRGAIWYQGESNYPTGDRYFPLMTTLIGDWRRLWAEGDFPFLFVQLANHKKPATDPNARSEMAPVREGQLQTLQLPNTGMAVAIDLGDADNIHPKNKQDVGYRLALVARARVYGENIPFSGPLYDSMTIRDRAVRLKFKHADGGLAARGGKLTGFALAGDDGKFVWADAKIEGDTVMVSHPDVPKPAAVRYGWADNPAVNLYNGAGLPASPFRAERR